jgi:hypothetical protein
MARNRTVIVAGYFARYPLGGHVLSILHYLVGLQRLGLEVIFVEHFGWESSCYDPLEDVITNDASYGIGVMTDLLRRFDIRAWCFVDAAGEYHGLRRDELHTVCKNADALLSIWETTWVDYFYEIPVRVFIDTDPGFTQFSMSSSHTPSRSGYASPHDFHYHFTYGTRLDRDDCPIPTHGITWHPTWPPIVLDLMQPTVAPDSSPYTTVMSWNNRAPVVYDDVVYGQKEEEFRKIMPLPGLVRAKFEVAVAGKTVPRKDLEDAGWRVSDARVVTKTPWTYLDYIARSRAEFSVAVNLEVKTRSGWFSDRTATYLALGKPAVVQDTGFSESLPCGNGLFAFSSPEEAIQSISAIERDYGANCVAARRIAQDHFDAAKVLKAILSKCNLTKH